MGVSTSIVVYRFSKHPQIAENLLGWQLPIWSASQKQPHISRAQTRDFQASCVNWMAD